MTLLVEARKYLYPRDIRQLVWRIKEISHRWSNEENEQQTIPLILAESISPGARELLKSERVGYYDSGGSLHIPAEGMYIYIDRPPPKPQSRSIRSLFSGRRAQVLHALLIHHGEWLGVGEIANMAQVSPGTASQVLIEAERHEWAVSRGQGPRKQRKLVQPAILLDTWAKQRALAPGPAMERFFVPSVRGEQLTQQIAKVFQANDAEYAITHEAAAQRYAPFLSRISRVRCRLLAGPAERLSLHELDARRVNEGVNLAVIRVRSADELLFRRRLDNVWLASPVQVYLDLIQSEGRTRELAEHMRRERIGF